jgi:Protein of unknown function (DUF2786)
MTREQAIERVGKLHAVTVARGATAAEAAVAAERAARLVARFGLRPAPARTRAYTTAADTDRRSSRSLRFVSFA